MREGRRVLAGTHSLVGALANPRGPVRRAARIFRPRQGRARAAALLDRSLPTVSSASTGRSRRTRSRDMRDGLRRAAAQGHPRPHDLLRSPTTSGACRRPSHRPRTHAALGLASTPSPRRWPVALRRQMGPAGAVLRTGRLCRSAQRSSSRESRMRARATSICMCGWSPEVGPSVAGLRRAGHLSEIVSVAQPATVTAYRLPFWHYTTPLVAKPDGRGGAPLGPAGHVFVPLSWERATPVGSNDS